MDLDEISLWYFCDISGIFIQYLQIRNLLFVCGYVSWLAFHLIKANIGISPVLDEISFWNNLETFLGCFFTIFQNYKFLYVCQFILTAFFLEISGMLTSQFQIILNILYVCHSVSCLTSLLKLYKYRDNSSAGWYIFLKFLGDILGTLVH